MSTLAKIVAGILLWLVAVVGIAAYTGVMLVDVDAAEGPRIVLPVPLAMARAGLAVAPEDVQRVRAPELGDYVPHARRISEDLRGVGDAELVAVTDGDQHVTVTKVGDVLRIRAVERGGATAEVTVPLGSLEAALRAYDPVSGSFRTSELVAALTEAPRGELVDVADGGDRVRIRRLF
jgi:hypothetical protein